MSTDPLFVKENGQHYFYHTDHLGTPQKITAVNGALVWTALYSSFGEAQVLPSSTVENNLRFPGQYYDFETGLHYNRHRYYDPEIGRYLRTDPIGLDGGVNLYAYVLNDPVNFIDPWGLQSSPSPFAIPCEKHPYGSAFRKAMEDQCAASGRKLKKCWVISTSLGNHLFATCCPDYPGDDPTKAPDGFEWRGRPGSTPGGKDGNYYNPDTGESLRPDLDHPDPVGPHWDYRDPNGDWYRIQPDGTHVPKQ